MRYVLLGKLSDKWVHKGERVTKSKAKAKELGVTLESIFYTLGPYDFVDVVSSDDPQAALAFSAWYSAQGYGSFTTMPAYTPEEFQHAIETI
jgi:uncharacterized protein with GYD domain